MEIHNVQRNL